MPKRIEFGPTWKQLLETLKVLIVGGKIDRKTWFDRIGNVHTLCVSHPVNHADQLYSTTKTFLEQHVTEKYYLLRASDNVNLLCAYSTCWDVYSRACGHLDQLYRYFSITGTSIVN